MAWSNNLIRHCFSSFVPMWTYRLSSHIQFKIVDRLLSHVCLYTTLSDLCTYSTSELTAQQHALHLYCSCIIFSCCKNLHVGLVKWVDTKLNTTTFVVWTVNSDDWFSKKVANSTSVYQNCSLQKIHTAECNGFDVCSRANEWDNAIETLKFPMLLEGEALAILHVPTISSNHSVKFPLAFKSLQVTRS